MELAVALQDVFVYNWDQTRKKPIAVISERFIRQHPTDSREVSDLYEFIDKVKQNIDAAIFTINMAEKPLSEIADFLEIFVQVKVPESVQSKSVALQVEKKTIKEIINDLGLEIGGTSK